jgi:curved DNA-binding protein
LGSRWQSGQEFKPPPEWGRDFEFSRSNQTGGMGGAGAGGEFSDFFASLFGAGSPFGAHHEPRPSRAGGHMARDHFAKIEIALDDAYRGGTHTIELKSPQLQPDGHVTVQPRTLRVTIPAGVTEGQQIRLAGQGHGGGDLYLEISFKPHRLFTAQGRDVTLSLPVAPWEAALGANVQVPTLGGAVEMRIPPGAQTGQRLRLKGRGLPGSGGNGDQYVALKIVLPPADLPRARALYEQMRGELAFDPRAALGV